MDDNTWIAWAAGLFEGEGCISYQLGGEPYNQKYARLYLAMTDRDVIDRFHLLVNSGGIDKVKRQKEHHKDAWRWRCTKRSEVERILSLFEPYLGERRKARALEILQSCR